MHRNRTWQIDPEELRTQRNRILPIEGGDGSTLSLDFTTGVLDPRLTFDRLSTATFINSSGLVQFANANLMTYSTPRASGSAWGTTGTVTWGSATITDPLGNATAQEVTFGTAASAIFNTAGTTVVSGITHTFSVWLRAASGTTNVRIGDANVGAVSTVTLTTTWQRFSCQYVASGTNDGGAIYSQTGTPSSTVYVWGAQVQPGSIVGELLETTGTLRRNIPRFDYDPTTLAPRGLLIEGQATNVCEQGQYCWGAGTTSSWGRGAGINVNAVNGTSGANAVQRIDGPDGGSLTGTSIFKDSGPPFVRLYADFAVQTNTTYTWSAYVRAPSGGNPYIRLGAFNGGTWLNTTGGCTLSTVTITNVSGSGSRFNGVPSGSWVRVWVTFTTQAAQTLATIAFYPDSDTTNAATMYVWGSQVETGSGPSSVIPTGASQGTRNADSCVMTGTNFSSWFAGAKEGVMFVEYEKARSQSGNVLHDFCAVGSRYNTGEGFILYNSVTTFLPTAILWPTGGAVFGGGIATAIPSVTKQAAKWFGGNDVTNYSNGVIGSTGAGTGTVTPAMLSFGANSATGTQATRDWLNACVRKVKFWPVALPDSQIIGITT